ncbi:uncharacterized protein LOC133909763 [Phragmites australis]|uniref:uncharacterized protein LOC133909763 n=1 Tax=Phragmites australis TaxID=29695 RepID=UPI002D79D332|nr:uncharacterized protein LOC133909763 [Phragmites australis]
MQSDADAEDHYLFFSAPASPVHYILRSPPSSTAHYAPPAAADGDCLAAADFEFAARGHGPGTGLGGMSSAEELFAGGRIRVRCSSPIRQETVGDDDGDEGEERGGGEGLAPRTRRARSASPPRSARAAGAAEPSDPFASASSSSSSSSSSSAKNTRRRISLRDLLTRTGGDSAGEQTAGIAGAEFRSGFWPPSIWPSRSKKALLPYPVPQPGRRSTSSDRAAPPKSMPRSITSAAARDEARRRTTSLPYRQGLVLGCLGFGARGYGLAKSMHPLFSQ